MEKMMMAYFIGSLLILVGLLQLLFQGPSVRLKRAFKPWWTDKAPAKDALLLRTLHCLTFAWSVCFIELGLYLTHIALVPLLFRLAAYMAIALVSWHSYCSRIWQKHSL